MTNDECLIIVRHWSFVIRHSRLMSSRRVLKAAEAIREVVSMAILTDLRDPRIEGVTVTYVEVSPDMRQAKVHVSIMGSETQQKLCLHGLRSSAGYLQSKISDRIDTRYTPRLRFELDEGVKKSLAISQMLQELLPGNDTASKEAEPGEDEQSNED
jgi:ribosome-binding factor A